MDRTGKVQSINNSFVGDLVNSVNTNNAVLTAGEAVLAAIEFLDITAQGLPEVLEGPNGPQKITRLQLQEISIEEILAQLMWLPIRFQDTRLVWNFQIHTLDQLHVYDMTVDAVSGKVWTSFDWVSSAQYQVFEQPIESPIHVSPLDRQLVLDPANLTASQLGWHDTGSNSYTITRGNNVQDY